MDSRVDFLVVGEDWCGFYTLPVLPPDLNPIEYFAGTGIYKVSRKGFNGT
jgi:hypothetical protein